MLMKWIETIHSMTEFDVLNRLPKFFDKLFDILNQNPKHDVYNVAISQLKLYVVDYEKSKSRSIQNEVKVLHIIIGFLNKNKILDIDNSRFFAITCLEEFINYFLQDLDAVKFTGIISKDKIK